MKFFYLKLFKFFVNISMFPHWVYFVIKQNRLPRKGLYINDYLHRLKIKNELLDPVRIFVSDKYLMKTFVSGEIGKEYNVPTIGYLHTTEQVNNFDFPSRCCIKPTHMSGEYILRTKTEPIDLVKINSWLKTNYSYRSGELNYLLLKPAVIVEPLVFDRDDNLDFKFFCYKGNVTLIQVDFDRKTNHTRAFYDKNWEKQNFSIGFNLYRQYYEKPSNLDEMISVASKLSKKFEFIRIDLYTDGNKIYVGEITNCHGNALETELPKFNKADFHKFFIH